ncbi:hypothetical protein KEM52_004857, partial [Ascosphaera acerosa]
MFDQSRVAAHAQRRPSAASQSSEQQRMPHFHQPGMPTAAYGPAAQQQQQQQQRQLEQQQQQQHQQQQQQLQQWQQHRQSQPPPNLPARSPGTANPTNNETPTTESKARDRARVSLVLEINTELLRELCSLQSAGKSFSLPDKQHVRNQSSGSGPASLAASDSASIASPSQQQQQQQQ